MKVLHVPDMHCVKCVERITRAMEAEGISARVDLDTKTVTVAEADAARAVSALDDIGFDAE